MKSAKKWLSAMLVSGVGLLGVAAVAAASAPTSEEMLKWLPGDCSSVVVVDLRQVDQALPMLAEMLKRAADAVTVQAEDVESGRQLLAGVDDVMGNWRRAADERREKFGLVPEMIPHLVAGETGDQTVVLVSFTAPLPMMRDFLADKIGGLVPLAVADGEREIYQGNLAASTQVVQTIARLRHINNSEPSSKHPEWSEVFVSFPDAGLAAITARRETLAALRRADGMPAELAALAEELADNPMVWHADGQVESPQTGEMKSGSRENVVLLDPQARRLVWKYRLSTSHEDATTEIKSLQFFTSMLTLLVPGEQKNAWTYALDGGDLVSQFTLTQPLVDAVWATGVLQKAAAGHLAKAEEARVLNQIRQVALAARLFAQDHAGQLPMELEQLAPYLGAGFDLSQYELLARGKLADIHNPSAVIMVRSNRLFSGGAMGLPALPGNQASVQKRAVAFVDGHVSFIEQTPEPAPVPPAKEAPNDQPGLTIRHLGAPETSTDGAAPQQPTGAGE